MFVKMLIGYVRKASVFDWLIVVAVIASVIFFANYFFRQKKWIEAELIIAPEQWWWESSPPQYWLTDSLNVGDSSYDSWGRKEAELIDITNLEWGGTRREVTMVVRFKVEYDSKTKKYKYHYRPLEIGSPIDLEIGGVKVAALVIYVEGMPDLRKKVTKTVLTRVRSLYTEQAEAIKIGDTMKDTRGRIVATVLDKTIMPSQELVISGEPVTILKTNPYKSDVIVKVKLEAVEQNGLVVFRSGQVIKIGNGLYLKFTDYDISGATITKILSD